MTSTEFKEWRLAKRGKRRSGKTHPGWSQSDAARHFGLSIKTIQSWESGGRPVPKRIAKLLEG